MSTITTLKLNATRFITGIEVVGEYDFYQVKAIKKKHWDLNEDSINDKVMLIPAQLSSISCVLNKISSIIL